MSALRLSKQTDFSGATKDYLQIRDMLEPHKERHARYDELFEQLLAVRQSTSPIWKQMADGRARLSPAAA